MSHEQSSLLLATDLSAQLSYKVANLAHLLDLDIHLSHPFSPSVNIVRSSQLVDLVPEICTQSDGRAAVTCLESR
jgi:hypothetical protein